MDAPKVTPAQLDAFVKSESFTLLPNGRTLVCQLELMNGFTVEGQSACVDARNFDMEMGKGIARKNAKEKMWPLLGFQLADKLHAMRDVRAPEGGIAVYGNAQTYLGTKAVHAVPMNRLAYNQLRGWELPADENGMDEGYLVQYADGGDPNLAGFTGYVSWSPKAIFEKAYQTLDYVAPVKDYKERVVDETKELIERHQKLAGFLQNMNEVAATLDPEEIADLQEQKTAMEAYLTVLTRRLNRMRTQGN